MSEMTTNSGPAMEIVQKFVEEEEREREKKLHVALQVGKVVYLAPDTETRLDDPKIIWRSTAHTRSRHGGAVPTEREPAASAKFQTDQELMRKMREVRAWCGSGMAGSSLPCE